MNAPYDGDRGRGAHGDPPGPVPATPQVPAAQDPYVQDAYRNDPHHAQDPTAQDPVAEALYDRAAHPPPPPGQAPHPLYQQPPAASTHPTRSCGPRRRLPSRRARPAIFLTATTRQRRSSWASTT